LGEYFDDSAAAHFIVDWAPAYFVAIAAADFF
jgi:hypothetical protein